MNTFDLALREKLSLNYDGASYYTQDLSKIANIFQEKVNISIWQRNLDSILIKSAEHIIYKNPQLKFSKVLKAQNVIRSLIHEIESDHKMLIVFKDIAMLVDNFCKLFELKSAWLRLDTVDQQICPRFHADNVVCRLVTTYIGPATQWLPNSLINREKLGNGNLGLPDDKSGLFSKKTDIQQLDSGDVALLKGRAWKGNEESGLVHRSPYEASQYKRLYLTIDFADIFTDIYI